MSLLFQEPFDGYETNIAFYLTKNGMSSNGVSLTRNYFGVTGRPSGSIFFAHTLYSTTNFHAIFANSHRETITYVAVYIPSGAPYLQFWNTTSQGLMNIRFSTTQITVDNNVTNVFSSSAAIPFNTWNFLEIHSVISTTNLTSGSVKIKNNGILLFSASNINTNGNNVANPAFGAFGYNTNGSNIYMDDILILNTTGSTFSGSIGNGNFFMTSFVPSSSGFYTGMTSSGATTDANAINERPPNSDTSYLIATSSGAFPLRETFTLRPANTGSSFTTIPTNSTIEAIIKNSRARATVVEVSGLNHLLRVNGADYTGSVPISASVTYDQFVNGWEINPNTGNKFLPSEIPSLEVGFRRDS
jgi:hypothetical protein